MTYVRVTAALGAVALLTFVSHAQAQSLAPEGELHVTFTATQVPPVAPMPIGDGKQYLQVNYIMSASNDQGNAVLNNMGGRCQLNRLIDASSAKPVDLPMRTDRRHRQIPGSASVGHHNGNAGQEYLRRRSANRRTQEWNI